MNRLVRALALAPVLAGLGVLVLWLLGRPELASFGQGRIPMAPSSALLFCLFGLALFFSAHRPDQRALQRAAFWSILLGATAALGLGSLSALGLRPRAEHLGFLIPPVGGGASPLGHMSPVTAAAFLLAALAYLTAPTTRVRRFHSATLALGCAALLTALGLLLVLAYLFGVPLLYGTAFIPPALLTGLAFFALSLGLALRTLPQLGFLRDRPEAEVRAGLVYIGVFALFTAISLGTSFIHFRRFEAEERTQLEQQLNAIAELKVRQLAEYRKERLADASMIMTSPGFSELASRALQSPISSLANRQFLGWMDQLRLLGQYPLIRLVDAGGEVRLSSPVDGPPPGPATLPGIAAVLRSGKPQLQDFYLSEREQQSHLALLLPILDPSANPRVLGVLALRIDPRLFLYPFLKSWPVPSHTAETLLVRRDADEVVFLNELRHVANAPLRLRFPISQSDLPAARAARGHAGLVEGRDYRGAQVVASVQQVPDSPWSLVARIDVAEAFAPVRARVWQLLGLNLVLAMAAAAGLGFLWRSQRFRLLQATFHAEHELKQAEKLLQLTRYSVEHASDAIFWMRSDASIADVNEAACRSLGYTRAELLGLSVPDVDAHYDAGKWPGHFTELRQRGSLVFESEQIHKDGHLLSVEVVANYVKFGEEERNCAFVRDITERKQTEETLKANEARFRSWFDLPIIGICITSPTKGWLEVNPQLCAMLGYEREEFAGLDWPILTHPEDLTADVAQFESVLRGDIEGYSLEKRFIRKNGGIVQTELAVRCVRKSDGEVDYFVALINDITARKQLEEANRLSEARYAMTIAAVNDGLWDWDVSSGKAYFSPLYYALLGYEDQEFSATYASWRTLVHPEDLERTECELRKSIGSGEGFAIDLRMKMKSGEWRWASTRGKTVELDAEGRALRLVGTLSDISERKRVEEELQQIYAEITRFTYTVSHDLKSPLVTVKTFLGYLQEDLRKNDAAEVATDLGYINNATERMGRLLDELLELSRIGRKTNPAETISLQDLAKEALGLVAGRLVSRGIQVAVTQDPILLFGDRQRLVEVFQNLLDNAAKFMGDQPSPRVEIGVETAGPETVLFVRDNGIGIDPRHLSKLFGLFEKLDPEAEGSGIGLATARRIVELHGGRIWVESAGPGTGTTFRFTLANIKRASMPGDMP